MRTGMCSSDFNTMPSDDFFKKMFEMRVPVVQLAFSSISETDFTPDGNIEIPDGIPGRAADRIAADAKCYGIEIAAVNGTFNMAHPDAAVRREGVRRFDGFLESVKRLGVGVATLCSGTRNRDSLWAPHPDNGTPSAWDDMYETMCAVTETAGRYGITLAIETEASNIIDTPGKARLLLHKIGSPYLKMIMDCANLFHAGEARRPNVRAVMRRAFECFGRDVVIAHGKDIRESDGIDFCATGEGIVDFEYFTELLAEYGYTGDMLLHGIYDESKIPACIDFYNEIRQKHEGG